MSDITTLYRIYGHDESLLYIGISGNPGRRFKEHQDNQPWWSETAGARFQHFETRAEAERAEPLAIRSEFPKYNKVHNGSHACQSSKLASELEPGMFTYRRRDGSQVVSPLWLRPELLLEPYVDEWCPSSGQSQLSFWVNSVKRSYPEEYEADAVPILWLVMPAAEFPPYQKLDWTQKTFLSHYTRPYDSTGFVDWFSLEVRNDRRPEFAQQLGWEPSAMQPTCPLRSIIESKNEAMVEW